MSGKLYKTELCRSFEKSGRCSYHNKCQFAHGAAELKAMSVVPNYKTKQCDNFRTGLCYYGKRCCFIHLESRRHSLEVLPIAAASPARLRVFKAIAPIIY